MNADFRKLPVSPKARRGGHADGRRFNLRKFVLDMRQSALNKILN